MSVDLNQSINQAAQPIPSASAWFRQRKASEQWYTDYNTGHRDRRLRRASERRPVPRDSRRAGAGRIGRRTTPRKQERVLPQSRRKSKKNCPPSQPISSRIKKQRRDPSYCTNLHLARWRGVLNKENVDAGSRACRWFSWLPTIPSRRGRTLHSRPGGPLHCTALHCNSTRSVHYTSLLPSRSGTHSSPQLPAAQNPPIDDRDDAPLCLSSKKKKAMCPNTPCTWPRIATTHTTPIARTGSRTASPSGISRHARTPPRLTLRLTVQSSCPPSPALLPCFHTSTQNRLNCPAAQQLAPSSLRLARASGCMTHVTLEGLVGLVGFFTAGSE